jgi:hypothetical protein
MSKIEKLAKYIEKINDSDLSYGFCSHFHRIYPLGLLFYMKYHDAHEICLYILDPPPKMLRKNTFFCFKVNPDKNPRKKETVSLEGAKSIFLKHFWRLIHEIRKNFMCTVVLHVKLQRQQTKSVEMRAKSV